MRFPNFEFFDGTREYIEAKNYAIKSPYDGSKLYNVKPASIVIPFTNANNSPQVVWDSQYAVTFTHSLNCYPIIHVYDNGGNEMWPDVKINSGTSFTLSFGSNTNTKPGDNQTYICTVTYGAEYGVDGNINTDVETVLQTIQRLVDEMTGGGYNVLPSSSSSPESSSEPEIQYVPINAVGVPGGVAALDEDGIVPRGMSPLNGVSIISTTQRNAILFDASMPQNNYKNTYIHCPYIPVTYVLPDVEDESIVHEIVLEVRFQSFVRDSSNDVDETYLAWSMHIEEYNMDFTLYTTTENLVDGETIVYYMDTTNNNEMISTEMPIVSHNVRQGPHDITIMEMCMGSSVIFVDEDNNELVPVSTPEIGFGTIVNYLCRWSTIAHKWCIMPVVIAETSIIEAAPVSNYSPNLNYNSGNGGGNSGELS